jgi:two-component system cell cycle sensor histidine kinase/response regulator CckA
MERRRVAAAVRAVGVSFVVGILPALYLQWANNWIKGFVILLATEAAAVATLALNRAGKTQWAAETLTGAGVLCACSMVFFSRAGYRDLALLLFPAMLAVAALLLTRRYVVYAIATVGSAAVLIFLQATRLNPNAREPGNYFDLLNVSIILGLISVALGLLANAMRRTAADHRALIEQAGEGVIALDDTQRIRMCNSTASEILGAAVPDLLGRSFQTFAPSRDLSIDAKVSFDMTVKHADGSSRHLLTTCTPRLNAKGRRVGIIVVMRDVTKAHEADNQIRLMAQALRSTDSCVRISDMSDRIIYVNPAFLHTYGYSEAELLGHSIEIVRSPRNNPGFDRQILTSTLTEGWSGELWSRGKDGREFPTALTCSVVRNDRGEAIATVGVSRDLSHKKAVEDALEESRRRFQALLEHGDLMTLFLDQDGAVTFCNDTMLDRLGIPREAVIGKPAVDLLAPECREAYTRDFETALRLDRPDPLKEYALIDSRGGRRWFQWSITPLRAADGALTELACVGFEITEQRILREQYLQALKLDSIGRLAGGIAHDFNNLLTVINGYSTMLVNGLAEGDPNQPFARQIYEAGMHAANLTKQLLTFSRRQMIQPRPTELGAIVRDSQRMLERVIGEDIRLVIRLHSEDSRVMADPDQIRQVVMNLAVNARDAMPDGGTLEISTRTAEIPAAGASPLQDITPGEYVLLTVSDSGVGMDAETLQHVFEPFFTTKGPGKGTGLGMATVYGIVKQSRGSIDVSSRPGAGTTVNVYLPRTDAAACPEEAPAPVIDAAGGEIVLIVEDQDSVRQLAARVLKHHGYRLLEAASGPEALRLLKNGNARALDLLLTDVILPGMSGRELAEHVRGEIPGIKVLFMSGYSGEALGRRGVLENGLAFLPKPFTPAALVDKVRNLLSS